MGTPDDILRLIEAGHVDKLSFTRWAAAVAIGMPVINMVQLAKNDAGACIMFDNGLCKLHTSGLKPFEGKLAMHVGPEGIYREPGKHPTIQVAKTWLDAANIETMHTVATTFGKHHNLLP